MLRHRNSFKRFYKPGLIYFIVAKTKNNLTYFKNKIFCELLIKELQLCKNIKKFELYAFSIIYDHLNVLICPNDDYNISQVMKSLKENSSRDINHLIFDRPFVYEFNEFDGLLVDNYDITKRNRIKMKSGGDTSMYRHQIREFLKKSQAKFNEKDSDIPKFAWQRSFL